MWGRRRARASARPMVPRPMDLATAMGVSSQSPMSTLSSMVKPSSSMTLYVSPNFGDRCAAVTTSCRIRSGSASISFMSQ